MLVTDALRSSEAAAETAAQLALRHSASLMVVDAIRPPSRTAQWMSRNANDVFEMVVADKQARLDAFVERLRAMGIEAESRVLIGKSSEAITNEVVDEEVDLVIRYRKGLSSKYPGLFGNTARNLMRVCPCPVLFVNQQPLRTPRVLACIDASHDNEENTPILEHSRRLAADEADLFGVYCWDFMAADLLSHRLSEDAYEFTLNEAKELYGGIFQRFQNSHALEDFGDRMRMEKGDPATVIPAFCESEEIGVVVMSSIAMDNRLLRLLGSTVESVMERLPCSLMVVKPSGFQCPLEKQREREREARLRELQESQESEQQGDHPSE